MNRKTIIYIGGFELPDKNAAAHRVLNNAKALRELGYDVVFISANSSLESKAIAERDIVQGFDCWFTPYPNSGKGWVKYLTSLKSFKQIISNYTNVVAVICYNYQSLPFARIWSYCKKRNIKVISDCTEWYDTKGSNIITTSIKSFDSFVRMKIIHRKLDGLIVISRYLENYYKDCRNVIRIPPLVDKKESKWDLSARKNETDNITFLYAGSPGETKDKLNYIIETLNGLKNKKNFLFQVIGITKEQYLNKFPEHTDMIIELQNRVVFLGRLSHINTLEYLKSADFSLFLRDINRMTMAGFPTKFAESNTCGIPVITNKTSDLHEYLTDGENGYWLNIGNKIELSKELEGVLNTTREEINSMKKNCSKSPAFDYRNYNESFKKLLENLN